MRKIGRIRRKKQKKIIMITSLSLLLFLCVGYAAFSTQLSLKAKGNIKQNPFSPSDLIKNVVDSGDGLYYDECTEERYFYKGANPNNYITFNNETWRILSVEPDKTLKIVKNEVLTQNYVWSDNGNKWSNSSLNTYLNNNYYNSLDSNSQKKVVQHDWMVGAIYYEFQDSICEVTSLEEAEVWTGNIGLISVSEYLKANNNTEQCGRISSNDSETCKTTNWLFLPNLEWWTITAYQPGYVGYLVMSIRNGRFTDGISVGNLYSVRPSLYLSSDIKLTGEGTTDNPYKIIS